MTVQEMIILLRATPHDATVLLGTLGSNTDVSTLINSTVAGPSGQVVYIA